MMNAVCSVPVAPLRKEPTHSAEMVSQLLFGEHCTITEAGKGRFVKIVVKADGYEGWCQLQHLTEVSDEMYNTKIEVLAGDWVNALRFNGNIMHVPFGSTLLNNEERIAIVGNNHYAVAGNVVLSSDFRLDDVQKIAFTFLNTAYLWGGRSVFGVDCSGFTQVVYKFFGIALLRDARQQATQGTTVDFLQQAKCGDLAFFDNDAGDIIHVGLLLNPNEIIHASAKVQIDDIDSNGIISRINGQRTQKLRIIKRYFNDNS